MWENYNIVPFPTLSALRLCWPVALSPLAPPA